MANIQIDKELYADINKFFNNLNYRQICDMGLDELYFSISDRLKEKNAKIEARTLYGAIVGATDEEQRDDKRIDYLRHKQTYKP